MRASQPTLFPLKHDAGSIEGFLNPSGYKGIYAFHKYWGKKPTECLSFLIERLSEPNDLVVDPFLGFGLIAREAVLRDRRFIGCDVNPIAVELTSFLLDLPHCDILSCALKRIEDSVRDAIERSYEVMDGRIATHYLWNENGMIEVWLVPKGKGQRTVLLPTDHDKVQYEKWSDYKAGNLRPIKLFDNSRINSKNNSNWGDLFTGRALRNIDLIIDAIKKEPPSVRRALLLILTAASGQMSKMVFAISNRGKKDGKKSDKVEVGSWVIGYWKPKLHFEINVWHCYSSRARKLLNALKDTAGLPDTTVMDDPIEVFQGEAQVAVCARSATDLLRSLPDSSVQLFLTDPPHGDRIPYLELSEMWNALLGKSANYPEEIVVSNAQERGKTRAIYSAALTELFEIISRKIKDGGYCAVIFNSKDKESWTGLDTGKIANELQYVGCLPMVYSSRSVVQDNREGSLKHDFVLLYCKSKSAIRTHSFETLPGWSHEFPIV
ncbi:MAG: type II modification methylase [Blastocatellia bacterium]|nr:type II modification methylase [Blastocatellia bacterium]